MRGNPIIGGRIPNPISNHSTKQSLFLSSSPFSTSFGGGGRGRGRGGPTSNKFDFSERALGKPDSSHAAKPDSPESSPPPPSPPQSGIGHGRGNPILPAFSSFMSSLKPSQSPIGCGRGTTEPSPPAGSVSHKIHFTQSDGPNPSSSRSSIGSGHGTTEPRLAKSLPANIHFTQSGDPNLPSSIQSALSGTGRGKSKPDKLSASTSQVKEENRHIRVNAKPKPLTEGSEAHVRSKISREEAVKRAVSILSQGDSGGRRDGMGRGRGRGRGGGGDRGMWERRGKIEDSDEGLGSGLFLGDDADGEKLAEKIGMENMNKLIQGFEKMSGRILPSPMEDAYLDALHTNYMIEFEPEYLMGEFDQNPDVDEKPPMPLRDVLEKVKPFIMAYDGIQSQEEWEEVIEETMKNVPLLKEIVDHYSGPDRITAKKQQEELERVAKTIPASAPASVKRFAGRAVLSLQSNPGWGFDKKCQFMDKLVREVNQCYN